MSITEECVASKTTDHNIFLLHVFINRSFCSIKLILGSYNGSKELVTVILLIVVR